MEVSRFFILAMKLLSENNYFSILFNGMFAVYTFYVLSGRVVASSYLKRKEPLILAQAFIKRPLRLALPICSSLLLISAIQFFPEYISFLKVKTIEITGSTWHQNTFQSRYLESFGQLMQVFKLVSFRNEDISFPGGVLHTMSPEFIGSNMIFVIAFITSFVENDYLRFGLHWFIYNNMLSAFNPRLLSFYNGFILNDLYASGWLDWYQKLYGRIPSTLINFYLLCYHVKGESHWNSPTILIFVIETTWILQCVLSIRPLVWLGYISFALYLLHSIVNAVFGGMIIVELTRMGFDYATIFWVTLFACLIVSFILAHVFTKLVDDPVVTLTNKMAMFLTKKDIQFVPSFINDNLFARNLVGWVLNSGTRICSLIYSLNSHYEGKVEMFVEEKLYHIFSFIQNLKRRVVSLILNGYGDVDYVPLEIIERDHEA